LRSIPPGSGTAPASWQQGRLSGGGISCKPPPCNGPAIFPCFFLSGLAICFVLCYIMQ
jgi:hypothetical protein